MQNCPVAIKSDLLLGFLVWRFLLIREVRVDSPTDSSLQTSLGVHVMFILFAFVVDTVIDVTDL